MKKLLILLTTFTSCNHVATLNDPENPFIVTEIEQMSSTHSKYSDWNTETIDTKNPHDNQSIILPNGLYNIGDTIYFYKFHAQPLKKD